MGFFLTQQKLETKRKPKGERQAPITRQNAATLNRLGCAACPLNNANVTTPKMQPTLGASSGHVYFLAEAPGRHEDETSGAPLTGPSGRLLRQCIPSGEESHCSFDNVVRDRPENNRTPTWVEVECCRNHVVKSIEEAKPFIIVGLGAEAMSAMIGSRDMTGMRGRLFAIKVGSHECWFMPTYHPSFVLRKAHNQDKPLNSYYGFCLRKDIERAFDNLLTVPRARVHSVEAIRAGIQCFNGSRGYADLMALLKRACAAPIKAIDLETSGLRPFIHNPRILTCAISIDKLDFSFAIDHPKAGWSKEEKNKILFALNIMLTDGTTKIAHNVPFELEWLTKYFGPRVVKHDQWDCTQMMAHFIDERRGKQVTPDDKFRASYQSLEFLCKQYFGIAYKHLFKLNKKDMASADLDETLTYNAVDTKYTLQLWHKQKNLLIREGLWAAYKAALPRQATVALMQFIGVHVDQPQIKTIKKELSTEIKAVEAEISDLKVVKKYRVDHGTFNPMSNDELVVILRDYLKRTEIEVDEKTKTLNFGVASKDKKRFIQKDKVEAKKYSTDKNVLEKIPHPLARLVVELRNLTKLKSVNIDPFEAGTGKFIWSDGLIHTSLNTTFTETGRTSSDEPNMQNFPKRNDAWIRRIVVPPKNHVLIACDYGQLEGCCAAMCSKDKTLVKAMWEQYDIHSEWMHRLVKRWPDWVGGEDINDKAVAKHYRSIAKNKLVFPAIYGASTPSIAGYLKVPDDVAEDIMGDFWSIFTGLTQWQNHLMRGFYENGYVASPTGRRRSYPLSRNQAINFPVQGVASDIVCDSMNVLSQYAVRHNIMELHPVLNIHDDLTFVVPDTKKDIDDAISAITDVMLHPQYDFINVPLSVEVAMGHNWYEMSEVGKYWSNQDGR